MEEYLEEVSCGHGCWCVVAQRENGGGQRDERIHSCTQSASADLDFHPLSWYTKALQTFAPPLLLYARYTYPVSTLLKIPSPSWMRKNAARFLVGHQKQYCTKASFFMQISSALQRKLMSSVFLSFRVTFLLDFQRIFWKKRESSGWEQF